MGADTKKLRLRIKSVNSTLHLTKAMELVASSKIRKATSAMQKSKQYSDALSEMIDSLSCSPECEKCPYMREQASPKTRLIVIAGDRGLAGGYNANIFRALREYPDAGIIPIGKRVCDRFDKETVSSEHFDYEKALEISKTQCLDFVNGEYGRLGIVCTKYVSVMTQEAEIRWILPLETKKSKTSASMIFEPNELELLNSAIPEYVAGMLYAAIKESFASEVSARRMAMDSAGKNAEQMIDDLTLAYNRARQGSITQEITEIVAGSGAIKEN